MSKEEEWTAADDLVEEVREVRRRLWERFDNDPAKYGAYLRELSAQPVREGWTEAPPREPPAGEIRRLTRFSLCLRRG